VFINNCALAIKYLARPEFKIKAQIQTQNFDLKKQIPICFARSKSEFGGGACISV
jgi:putative transposon-encoded protein